MALDRGRLECIPNIHRNEWIKGNPELCCEWWYEDRKLTVYFDKDEVYYLKVTGSKAYSEIIDGFLWSAEYDGAITVEKTLEQVLYGCIRLWNWLVGEDNA